MKKTILLLLTALALISLRRPIDNPPNALEKKYSLAQLRQDFKFIRDTLEKYHPRLYEFTPKVLFNKLYDSLNNGITEGMNEIEFRHHILPLISKVHCAHTLLSTSQNLAEDAPKYYKCPPFKLYFADRHAYVRINMSNDSSLKPGTEIFAINNIPIKTIIDNYSTRFSIEGIHTSGIYYNMNFQWTTLFYGIRDYYKISEYTLQLSDKIVTVKSISLDEYGKQIPRPNGGHNFYSVDKSTSILEYPAFSFSNDSLKTNYIANVFRSLKENKTENLIVDLRGNAGGAPDLSAQLIKYFMKKDFVYFDSKCTGGGYEDLKKRISIPTDAFAGKAFFLIDAGCNSSTGHFLSFVKKYKLGKMIGEESTSSFSCNSIGKPFVLPNSKLNLSCPFSIYETTVTGLDRAKGIQPDYPVNPSLKNILEKKDTVLAFTLNLIKSN